MTNEEEILRDIGFNEQTIKYIVTRFLSGEWSDHQTLEYQFGDIAAGIISDQTLEMYKKHVSQGVQDGNCHKYDCFVGNALRFILYYFPAACKDVAYAMYGNEMTEKDYLLLDAMREFALSYGSCAHPFNDSKHNRQKICKIF